MPQWLKLTLAGCGGLLVLMVLAVACTVILAAGTQDTANTKAPKGGGAEEDAVAVGDEPPPVSRIGESVAVGDAAWTITDARQATQLRSQFLEPKQGTFIVVDFDFKNNGTESKTLHQNALALLDGDDRQSDPDTDTFGYIPNDRNIFLEQVNPGVTEQGQIIFSVAPGASGFRLKLSDTNLFSSNEAYVDLGF